MDQWIGKRMDGWMDGWKERLTLRLTNKEIKGTMLAKR